MKAQLKRRLIVLRKEIDRAIAENNQSIGLMPALWSVYSYIWSIHSKEDLHDFCARCSRCDCSTCDKPKTYR